MYSGNSETHDIEHKSTGKSQLCKMQCEGTEEMAETGRVSENITTRPAAAIGQPKQKSRFWLKKTIYLLYKRSKTI